MLPQTFKERREKGHNSSHKDHRKSTEWVNAVEQTMFKYSNTVLEAIATSTETFYTCLPHGEANNGSFAFTLP